MSLLVASKVAFSDEATRTQSGKPNVVLILMDDMGWRDVGFMGNQLVETPNLDRLAKQGLVFTQAYASAPNCAPTRGCLMSGQYTPRHGIYTVVDPRHMPGSPEHKIIASDSKSELATEVVTVAESLRAGGYETGFFGMWNLGRGRTGPVTPGGQGFEKVVFPENIGFAKDAYFDSKGNYLTDKLTDEVLKFIEQAGDKPFFAYLPDHAVHAPFEPKPDLLEKYEKKLKANPGSREDPATSRAPMALAIWTMAMPTPAATPAIRTDSPAFNCPLLIKASWPVEKKVGIAAASTKLMEPGIFMAMRESASAFCA